MHIHAFSEATTNKSVKNGNLHEHQPGLGKMQHSPIPKSRKDLSSPLETTAVIDSDLIAANVGVITRQTSRASSASTANTTLSLLQSSNSTSLVSSEGNSPVPFQLTAGEDNSGKSSETPSVTSSAANSDTTSHSDASITNPEHNNTTLISQLDADDAENTTKTQDTDRLLVFDSVQEANKAKDMLKLIHEPDADFIKLVLSNYSKQQDKDVSEVTGFASNPTLKALVSNLILNSNSAEETRQTVKSLAKEVSSLKTIIQRTMTGRYDKKSALKTPTTTASWAEITKHGNTQVDNPARTYEQVKFMLKGPGDLPSSESLKAIFKSKLSDCTILKVITHKGKNRTTAGTLMLKSTRDVSDIRKSFNSIFEGESLSLKRSELKVLVHYVSRDLAPDPTVENAFEGFNTLAETDGLKVAHARWINPRKIIDGQKHSSVVLSIDLHTSSPLSVAQLRRENADIIIGDNVLRVTTYQNLQPKVLSASCQDGTGAKKV